MPGCDRAWSKQVELNAFFNLNSNLIPLNEICTNVFASISTQIDLACLIKWPRRDRCQDTGWMNVSRPTTRRWFDWSLPSNVSFRGLMTADRRRPAGRPRVARPMRRAVSRRSSACANSSPTIHRLSHVATLSSAHRCLSYTIASTGTINACA